MWARLRVVESAPRGALHNAAGRVTPWRQGSLLSSFCERPAQLELQVATGAAKGHQIVVAEQVELASGRVQIASQRRQKGLDVRRAALTDAHDVLPARARSRLRRSRRDSVPSR